MLLRDATSLQDIVSAAELIASFLQGIEREVFDDSPLIQSAVVRQIEIIGEATKRLSGELESTLIFPGSRWPACEMCLSMRTTA